MMVLLALAGTRTMGFLATILLLLNDYIFGIQFISKIHPGFSGSQMDFIQQGGYFLRSNNSQFAFGFYNGLVDTDTYGLNVVHLDKFRVVWTANRGLLVQSSDKFVFDKTGNVYLERSGRARSGVAWSTESEGKGAVTMELEDSGRLVLFDKWKKILWDSFSHPTDTLLPGQAFTEGMRLESFPKDTKLSHFLEFKHGEIFMYVGYETPQRYWSIANDTRKQIKKPGGKIFSSILNSEAWNFYDRGNELVFRFAFQMNESRAAVLSTDGFLSFINLLDGNNAAIRIPEDGCAIPEPCPSFNVCSFDSRCHCPESLRSKSDCNAIRDSLSNCDGRDVSVEDFVKIGDRLDYFALGFVPPVSKTDLNGCMWACRDNCSSCLALFFENSSGNCYIFDRIGSLRQQQYDLNSSGYVSYLNPLAITPISNRTEKKRTVGVAKISALLVSIAVVIIINIFILHHYMGSRSRHPAKERKTERDSSETMSREDDYFSGSFSQMPARFTFEDLRAATSDFSTRLGHGGFGSVYKGHLQSDGTHVAVKKLEKIGQGKKEFRAEVGIIGKVHHFHLVKLRGFCAEDAHRLLVYEYMPNGSLDKWIFGKNSRALLDWDTRFAILLGTAKGLAYLHEECDAKIVHCDVKPENVLLDENFLPKVSDFGLAKLMGREESGVFTTLRGTRGYLAPEWVTNHPISEKSDVYSFGILLLEIVGGRRSYELGDDESGSYFPSFVFEMAGEGRIGEIVDASIQVREGDGRLGAAINVGLCCIQDDMNSRPAMSKVVQMLEGVCDVPKVTLRKTGGCVLRQSVEVGDSGVVLSDARLSGPR